MKNILITSIVLVIFVSAIVGCVQGAKEVAAKDDTGTNRVSIKLAKTSTEPVVSESSTHVRTIADNVKSNKNLVGRCVSEIYDAYENDIIKNDVDKVNNLFTKGGLDYVFVFKDGSTTTIYCELNDLKTEYIIKKMR